MKKNIFAGFLLLSMFASFASCNSKEQKVEVTEKLSFKQIDKEFGIVKPLSTEGQKRVVKRYGSIENYRDALIKQRKKLNKNKGSSYWKVLKKRLENLLQ
ncbi:hypothetical protein [Marinifilum caeruleilacunae]|uniref:Lipoprotein n=1 Tax=Marinifilum caeruleilacunae TaxID=2499076 RepID=A0ABX1X062_9BACT|nr:hypothetical protein [Marinifilum caeruleilacunae]NOU61546.1 hypothetical protein [Marinifilum caeruleilacunae]